MKPTLFGAALLSGLMAAFFSDDPIVAMLGLALCGGLVFAAAMYPSNELVG